MVRAPGQRGRRAGEWRRAARINLHKFYLGEAALGAVFEPLDRQT
jgi:hypothetical protein